LGGVISFEMAVFGVLGFNWYYFLSFLGFLKLMCAFIKYFPQAIFNHRIKSTRGLSFFGIVLDFMGGLFSILQILFLAIANGILGTVEQVC
jgi:cystinosin